MKKLDCILLSLVYLLGTCSLTSCGKLTYEQSKNKLKDNFKVEEYLYLRDFDNSDVFEKYKYCYENAIEYCEPSKPYLKTTKKPNVVSYWEENRYENNFLYCFSTTEKEYFIDNNYTFYHFWALENKRILIFPNKQDNNKYSFSLVDEKIPDDFSGQFIENFVSLLEYDGSFGYVLSFYTQEFLDYTLSMLYNTDNLDYDIYFVKYEGGRLGFFFDIYLIPQEEKFSKNLVNKFAELGDFAYFDFDKIREN